MSSIPLAPEPDIGAWTLQPEELEVTEEALALSKRERFVAFASGRGGRRVIGALSTALLLAIWQACASAGIVQAAVTSSPWGIIVAAKGFYTSSQALPDLTASGLEILYGFALSLVLGIVLGIAVGTSKVLEAALDPFINLLYAMPRIALAPLFVIWFGIGLDSKIAVIFLSAVFPVILNTAAGMRSVDGDLVNMARSFGAGRIYVVSRVMLPASVPSIVAGIRLAIGNALLGMVVGELIASTRGFGYLIENAGNNFQTDLLFVGIFSIAITALILTSAVRMIERRLDKWRP